MHGQEHGERECSVCCAEGVSGAACCECCCRPSPLYAPIGMRVRGLLHIAILKLLKERPLHGSEVLRLLKEQFEIEVSAPAIYGALRKLEARGLVVATWDASATGPVRRVYRITEEGVDYLQRVTERLRKLRELVDKLLS